MPYTLVLLRHGQSMWNLENRFTGWVDVDLTEEGRAQAARAGLDLANAGIAPDVLHTSLQLRAVHTAELALRRVRPLVDPGAPVVAAQRTPLRRAPGQEQGRDRARSSRPSR